MRWQWWQWWQFTCKGWHLRYRIARRVASKLFAAGPSSLASACLAFSRDRQPMRIPLVINVFLVNLDNSNNVYMALCQRSGGVPRKQYRVCSHPA